MQGGADEHRRLGVAVEQHILPRDQHIVEDDDGIDLVEAVREGVILGRGAAGKAGAADELQPRAAKIANKSNGIVGQRVIAPIGDGRLGEGLIGIGGGGFILGAAHHDAGIGFAHHMQQHVRVLILRRLRAVALRIGIGGHVKRVCFQDLADMGFDIAGKLRVDLGQHVLPVEQRPHLAHRLVADAGDDAAHVFQHGIGGAALGPPIPLRIGKRIAYRIDFAVFRDSHHLARGRVMGHVVDAGADVDQRLEHRMRGHIGDLLAIHIDEPAIADRVNVLCAGADHAGAP